MRAVGVCLLVVALAPARPARATSLFVDTTVGDDANDGLSWSTARASIGSALQTAATSPGADTISVAAGRYHERVVVPADTTLLGGSPSGGGARDPAANPTVIDGGGDGIPVVHFPPGADNTVLDGFVVRGGYGDVGSTGGGILAEDAAPVIRDNVIEDNTACEGAGIALVYTAARPAASVENNVIRRNGLGLAFLRYECDPGVFSSCGGVLVRGPAGVDLGVVLSGNRIEGNVVGEFGGGACIDGSATAEHDILSDNSSGFRLTGGPVSLFDEAVVDSRGPGVFIRCGSTVELRNLTLAGNGLGVTTPTEAAPGDLTLVDSVLWDDGAEILWRCAGSPPSVSSSIVRGGFAGGTGIIDADPLFVPGPELDEYLSQVSAGQASTSPAIDAGSVPATTVGLDQRTTATDSALDIGPVNFGYHAVPHATLTILRGTAPDALSVHRVVAALPFLDDAGTLTDPALQLLFYRVAGAPNAIDVTADRAIAAVRLTFRPGS